MNLQQSERRPIVPTDHEDVLRRYASPQQEVHRRVGLLGKIFGSPKNASTNIIGFVVCVMLITLLVMIFYRSP